MTRFADVVAASNGVALTSSRAAKVAILAQLLSSLDAHEVPICVSLLSGVPRQGRIGIGFSIIVPLAFAMMPISMYFDWV